MSNTLKKFLYEKIEFNNLNKKYFLLLSTEEKFELDKNNKLKIEEIFDKFVSLQWKTDFYKKTNNLSIEYKLNLANCINNAYINPNVEFFDDLYIINIKLYVDKLTDNWRKYLYSIGFCDLVCPFWKESMAYNILLFQYELMEIRLEDMPKELQKRFIDNYVLNISSNLIKLQKLVKLTKYFDIVTREENEELMKLDDEEFWLVQTNKLCYLTKFNDNLLPPLKHIDILLDFRLSEILNLKKIRTRFIEFKRNNTIENIKTKELQEKFEENNII